MMTTWTTVIAAGVVVTFVYAAVVVAVVAENNYDVAAGLQVLLISPNVYYSILLLKKYRFYITFFSLLN